MYLFQPVMVKKTLSLVESPPPTVEEVWAAEASQERALLAIWYVIAEKVKTIMTRTIKRIARTVSEEVRAGTLSGVAAQKIQRAHPPQASMLRRPLWGS